MTTSVKSAPPPPPPQLLPDDPDLSAAAQAAGQPPPASTLPASVAAPPANAPTVIAASAGATPTPLPTAQGSAPPGTDPTPPPLPGAPAPTTATTAPVVPTSGDGFVGDKLQTTDQAKPGQPAPQEIIPLANAQTAYSAASAQVEERDKTLEGQLQEIGPGLRDQAQRDAYTTAYHQKYAADYDAKTNAANALSNAVNDPRNDFVAARDPTAAAQVANAAKTLATSPAAAGAATWMASKFGAGAAPALSATYRPFFSDEAVSETAGDAAVNAAGSGSADLKKLTSDLQSLANTGIGGVALHANLKAGADLIAKASGTQPPPTPVVGAANKHVAPDVFEDAYRKGAGPKFEAAAYLMAAAKVGLGPGETPAEQTEYLGQIALAAQGGVAGTQATAEQLPKINAFQKYASQGLVNQIDALKASGPALDVAGRALGALAGAAFGAADVQKGIEEGNGFRFIAAAGDLASAAGFIIEGATPLGLVGIGVASIANALAEEANADARHGEETELMTKANVNPAVADTIAHHPNALASINGIGGLDGAQIQSIAQNNPEVFKTDDAADAFAQVAKAAGLKGDDVPGFANALAQGPLGRDAAMQLAQDLKSGVEGKPYSPAWIVDHIANHGTYPGASAFLAQHAPKVVAESAARSEADNQFDSVLSDPMQSGSAFSYGLAHQDSPVYRAQFIKDAADKGVLPNAVSDRINAAPAEKASLVRALRDAANDGSISVDDANRYVAQLS